MPDTTPERPVIGVRVHLIEGPSVLHQHVDKFRVDEDGTLNVHSPHSFGPAVVHAARAWAWAELVHGEAEPPPPSAPAITTPGPNVAVSWTPNTETFTTSLTAPVKQVPFSALAADHPGVFERIKAKKTDKARRVVDAEAALVVARIDMDVAQKALDEAMRDAKDGMS